MIYVQPDLFFETDEGGGGGRGDEPKSFEESNRVDL